MIRLRDVGFSYRNGSAVLDGVNLELPAGLTLLLGPNGCGKSTLLKLLAGVERPDRGSVEIAGHDLWKEEVAARMRLAYVSEQPDLTPYATIRDVIRLVCQLRDQPAASGRETLEKAGIAGIAGRSIRELSMGQRRRAVLAAAWIGTPKIALLDEPLEAMDRAIREEILAWIDRLVGGGTCVVIATHEIEPFIGKAARALTVRDGKCELRAPLPPDSSERLAFLELWSRGVWKNAT
jgi:ABC-2 type transport system ATP-binding protein